MRNIRFISLLIAGALPVCAQMTLRGTVVMPDGSPPPQRATIERICTGLLPVIETIAGKHGEFFWRSPFDSLGIVGGMLSRCYLQARMKNLVSQRVDIADPKVMRTLELPPLVLRGPAEATGPTLPARALKTWNAAMKAYQSSRWDDADRLAREVARGNPQFAPAWNLAALACDARQMWPEAREAIQRAIAADSGALGYRLELTRIELMAQRWAEASQAAEELVKADTARKYPDAELNLGLARYMLNDNAGAREHWERYLAAGPTNLNAEMIRLKLAEMSRGTAEPHAVPPGLLDAAPEAEFKGGIEAGVPGGRKALGAIARLDPVPPRETFFAEYCRALARRTSRMADLTAPNYTASVQQFVIAATTLAGFGEARDGRIAVRLSLADPRTERALALLGWRVAENDGRRLVEPGDRPEDGARQPIARALGIDELAMKDKLESGGAFEFDIESETAPIAGGAAWNAELRAFPTLAGGIAEAFARDTRLARAYAGLAAMPADVAAGLAKRVGLRTLVAQQHTALWLYADTFRVVEGRAAVPGGKAAEPIWQHLAGAAAADPARFFEALLTGEKGRVAAFYAALARADAAHQRFFTATPGDAQRWLAWYRDSAELKDGVGVNAPGWESRVFDSLPLDAQGRLRFPGGAEAWPADIWSCDLGAVLALADLEQRRGRPLDADAARVLARNFTDWRPLFPYFETLGALGGPEFTALEAFAANAAAQPHAAQETLLAQWHSAAALIVLARKSGTLTDEDAARAFGELCRSGNALAVVARIAGPAATRDDAVRAGLLRLDPARAAAFDTVRRMQNAPSLEAAAQSGDPAEIGRALAGEVYGALLAPDALLVNENRALLRQHVFVPSAGRLFAPASLAGAHFSGGFMGFERVAGRLASAGRPDRERVAPAADPAPGDGPSDATGTVFRASGRLVEINATVTDDRGRLLDGLRADQFAILDGGQPATIAAFENSAAPLSCVLLLDTSLSMDRVVAPLKAAALRLIAGLRPADAVAVYSLTGGITQLQDFTTDKTAAARAVVRAELGDLTALYDGLVRVNRDLRGRTGKKVIIVLTDGEDTASALPAETAILRAKTDGVPIYTVAQGQAVRRPALLKELQTVSDATGAKAFAIAGGAEIGPVFANVLQDLLHGYLLAFAPAGSNDAAWRRIEVHLLRPGKVRARQGYYPE